MAKSGRADILELLFWTGISGHAFEILAKSLHSPLYSSKPVQC